MKHTIRKMKSAHRKVAHKIRAGRHTAAMHASVQQSISKWMDRSKDLISTFPTLNELRDEFADWHSFEPISLGEVGAV